MKNWNNKKTKIVATVGPACMQEGRLKRLIEEGVDVFRINSSHTTLKGLRDWIRKIRAVEKRLGRSVGILVDLQGPRVRTGRLKEGLFIDLKKGQKIKIRPGSGPGNSEIITTRCRLFLKLVKKGDPILLDNGIMQLQVESKNSKELSCRVVKGGRLGENKGINLPNAPTTLPALTAQDREAVKAAVRSNVDFIALSFVRDVRDIQVVKKLIKSCRKKTPVIAKIEKPQAVDNLDSILESCEGVMVARGDLGIELGVEKVPSIQKQIIQRANEYGKPIITATQMLESMMHQAQPTRAEVSDIANAVMDGTDAVMLSGETAIGDYPVHAVRLMTRTICEAGQHRLSEADYEAQGRLKAQGIPLPAIVTAHAAHAASVELGSRAIMVFTESGKTAQFMSKLKPGVPVIAIATSEAVCRRLLLFQGVVPLQMKFGAVFNQVLKKADQLAIKRKLLRAKDPVIMVTGKYALPAAQFTTKIHFIGEVR